MCVCPLPQEFEKPNSAYMLFYERAESSQPGASATVAAAAGAAQSPASPPKPASAPLAPQEQQPREDAADAQPEPAPAESDEPMLPASPLLAQAAPSAAAVTPNVLAQLANVSPLKVQAALSCVT